MTKNIRWEGDMDPNVANPLQPEDDNQEGAPAPETAGGDATPEEGAM